MTDARETIIRKTIADWEGGFSNNPADRGGPTKYGVTQKRYSEYLGRPATVAEVKALPLDVAVAIFIRFYWNVARLDLLPAALRPVVFDIAVNNGPGTAITFLQEALISLGASLKADGINGMITSGMAARAVADHGAATVINLCCDRRQHRYDGIVSDDPSQQEFARGWKRRCDSFRVAG